MAKRAVPARTRLSRLMKRADKALSEYVRADAISTYGGLCPLCLRDPLNMPLEYSKKHKKEIRKKNQWVCFHFIRRHRKILRWRALNVVGACSLCNYTEYRNPDLSRAWFINKFGVECYLSLVELSKGNFTPSEDYLKGIIDLYQAKLKALKEGQDGVGQTAADQA